MKMRILASVAALSLFMISLSAAEDAKPAETDIWKQCLSLDHGWMVNCLEKGIGALGEEAKKTIFKSPQWTAPDEAAKEPNPVAADEKSIEAGRVVYERNCLTCHGLLGRGDGPSAVYYGARVADLTNPLLKKRTDGEMFWKITEGTWPMPAFGVQENLSRDDIWKAINYIRTLSNKPKTEKGA